MMDTAIVYIQAMGNTNYANKDDGNRSLRNTGKTEDEVCKIFDMSGNLFELTTEYTTYVADGTTACPYTERGAYCYNPGFYTSLRSMLNSTIPANLYYVTFRPILYVK